jgi:hypothetical protein
MASTASGALKNDRMMMVMVVDRVSFFFFAHEAKVVRSSAMLFLESLFVKGLSARPMALG